MFAIAPRDVLQSPSSSFATRVQQASHSLDWAFANHNRQSAEGWLSLIFAEVGHCTHDFGKWQPLQSRWNRGGRKLNVALRHVARAKNRTWLVESILRFAEGLRIKLHPIA